MIRLSTGALAVLGTVVVVAGCVLDHQPKSYFGSWDPLILSPHGSAQIFDAGISFADYEVCTLGFAVECRPASYTWAGDAISVTVDGEPDAYMLYTLCDGYLVVHQKGGGQMLYARR